MGDDPPEERRNLDHALDLFHASRSGDFPYVGGLRLQPPKVRDGFRYLLMLVAGQDRVRDACVKAQAGFRDSEDDAVAAHTGPHVSDVNGGPAWIRVGRKTGMSQIDVLAKKQEHADSGTLGEFRSWFDDNGGVA